MRILITGGAGFIGSWLAESLRLDHEVCALDALLEGTYSSKQKVHNSEQLRSQGIEFLKWNLCSETAFPTVGGFDYVIHLAAMPGLTMSWDSPSLYINNNITATANLIKNLDKSTLKKFIYISTSSVYGKFATGDETSPTMPVSPYGVTKLAAEKLLLAHFQELALPVTILRIFSVYGPRQRTDMMYAKLFEAAMSEREIVVYGDGRQSRTNTFVFDIIDGIKKAIFGAKVGEIYNLGGEEEIELNEVIRIVERIVGKKIKKSYREGRLGDQLKTVANIEKAKKDFGYSPQICVLDGLEKQHEWLMKR